MRYTILTLIFSSAIFGQLPESKQATLIETISSSEVMIEATGIYKGKGKTNKKKIADVGARGVKRAIDDAKRSAIYNLLFGGTDPLISTPQERQNFDQYEAFFFDMENISNYITYEDVQVQKKVKIDGGKGIRIVKRFKVNKEMLKKDLESRGVLEARADLAQAVGNPVIMVLPAVATGESPLELLETNPQVRHAASVVESYLTARQYDVVVPEQQSALESLNSAQMSLGDREEDYAYNLALSIGSDVYITFAGAVEEAAYGAQKYVLIVRAYETTTARLLGTETGYSQGRQGEIMVSIEEAMNDAIDKVLSRISNYWKSDLERGIQYKLIVNLAADLDQDQVEEIQFAFMDAVDEVAASSKENIITDATMDYLLWCDPTKYDRSSKVYRYIKKAFDEASTDGTLRRVTINRKMILLRIDSE